jgi:DNA-binding HxlR family transcriptional regulator
MHWREQDTVNCSVGRTLEVVGKPWVLLILREIFRGLSRFDDIQRHLAVSPPVLSRRLDSLVENGLLIRSPYRMPGQRERYEYHLTEAGRALLPVFVALHEWGDAYRSDGCGPATVYRHRDCGAHVRLNLTCIQGHQLTTGEVVAEPGTGAIALAAGEPAARSS